MGEQVVAGFLWGCSSVGRAPALQAGGQEFESLHLHAGNEQCIVLEGQNVKYACKFWNERTYIVRST